MTPPADTVDIPLFKNIQDNRRFFSSLYQDSSDVILRSLVIGNKEAVIIYIEGLTDTQKLAEQVLDTLLNKDNENDPNVQTNTQINAQVNSLKGYVRSNSQANQRQANDLLELKNTLPVANIKEVTTFIACTDELGSGSSILILDGFETALSLGIMKFEMRSIDEPQAETSIRGSREGFTESIGVNMSLVRRIVKDPALKMKSVTVGTRTKTKVVIAYINGLVDQTLIKEIENRLNRIQIDGVLESGYIEQFIEDNPYSPFPQLLYTERPDVVGANLLRRKSNYFG